MKFRLLAICWLFFNAADLAAADDAVKAIALFQNKALMMINGAQHLMKKGDKVDGVTLVSSSGRGAVVRFSDGEEKTLQINQTIRHGFRKAQKPKMTVYANPSGMFVLNGSVNGRPTNFLIDTGATLIALSQADADRLGLAYESASQQMVRTASDIVPAWNINLQQVKVGDITVANVAAVVLQGELPSQPLLGMSFLQHLNMQRNGAAMVLEQKY